MNAIISRVELNFYQRIFQMAGLCQEKSTAQDGPRVGIGVFTKNTQHLLAPNTRGVVYGTLLEKT